MSSSSTDSSSATKNNIATYQATLADRDIYANVPSGKSVKGIYVYVPSGKSIKSVYVNR